MTNKQKDESGKMDMSRMNKSEKNDGKTPSRGFHIPHSYLWAFLFTAIIGGWMLSGDYVVGGVSEAGTSEVALKESELTTGAVEKAEPLFRVRVRSFHAQPRRAELTLRGRTEADAKVQVRAETSGVVEAMPAKKGDTVDKGTVLCRIEKGAREANMLEANAALAQAKADYEAAERLVARGHTAKLKVAEFRAKLDASRAMIVRAELDLERIEIKAPFRGIIEEQPAKPGDYLSVGGACARLVAVDPLVVVGAVSERDVVLLKQGMMASAKLVTGEVVKGPLRFISPASDAATRTFRIEMEVKNTDFALRDGMTADIRIPLASTLAHHFTPAILSLDDNGRIGVRVIAEGDIVKFMPVTILGDGENGLWVGGLPEQVTVITVGQDYVVEGQKVLPVAEQTAKSS